MTSHILLVGTRKGLFTLRSNDDRATFTLEDPTYFGSIVQHAVAHPLNPLHIVAGVSTGHLGPTVIRSTDGGRTFKEASRPPSFPEGEPLARSVAAVFWLTPSPHDVNQWFAGASPQGLFVSNDGGDTWESVSGWNDNPMWETWAEWPEAQTPDGSMLHSINIDPTDRNHLYLGLSSGGVFESTDGTASWHPLNGDLEHPLFPDKSLEFGQDPHCLRLHPLLPSRLYQQNHCGIYRLDRPSTEWVRIGDNMPREVGDIGFPIELHPRDPETVWVFPMDGTDVWPRTSPGGRPAVFRSQDGGGSWERQDNGLPARGWHTVKRQAMCTDNSDPVGLAFGTTSGEVWFSADEGDSWRMLAAHLPEIYSVESFELAE